MREANTTFPTRFGERGRGGSKGAACFESSARNLGDLAIAKAKAVVGRGHSSGETGNDRGVKGFYMQNETLQTEGREPN